VLLFLGNKRAVSEYLGDSQQMEGEGRLFQEVD
jgi:hypothetical protein